MAETITAEPAGTVFEALTALACEVNTTHTDDHGRCAVRGSAFPCSQAVLAAHNLAL